MLGKLFGRKFVPECVIMEVDLGRVNVFRRNVGSDDRGD